MKYTIGNLIAAIEEAKSKGATNKTEVQIDLPMGWYRDKKQKIELSECHGVGVQAAQIMEFEDEDSSEITFNLFPNEKDVRRSFRDLGFPLGIA
jgi:hypothetical protein